MCVLMVNCIPNHTKCVDISPAFVIASIKQIIQNVRTYHLVIVIAVIKNFQNGHHLKLKIVITLVCMLTSA